MLVQPSARDAREVASFCQIALNVRKEIVREPLFLLLLDLDVVMQELDLEVGRELFVQRLIHEVSVFGGDCLFSVVGRFRQVQAE